MEVSDMSNLDKKLRSGDRMIDHSSGYERSGTVGTFMWSGDETRQQARCSPFNIDCPDTVRCVPWILLVSDYTDHLALNK
jgi:hypothetical protein